MFRPVYQGLLSREHSSKFYRIVYFINVLINNVAAHVAVLWCIPAGIPCSRKKFGVKLFKRCLAAQKINSIIYEQTTRIGFFTPPGGEQKRHNN
jgi:hypothetical protein